MERFDNSELSHQKETYKIIGIMMEIHKVLGRAYLKLYIKMHLNTN